MYGDLFVVCSDLGSLLHKMPKTFDVTKSPIKCLYTGHFKLTYFMDTQNYLGHFIFGHNDIPALTNVPSRKNYGHSVIIQISTVVKTTHFNKYAIMNSYVIAIMIFSQ